MLFTNAPDVWEVDESNYGLGSQEKKQICFVSMAKTDNIKNHRIAI